ncbi:TIR domain-containing protein [Acinetobacter baumannii]|uniref:toll/interleukin-1 receptor domain-containing protein n=1 Tax=Acinetobacter TaxID=469 RepID=UPI0012987B25|nr:MULTISPECIES: toll/interleukin-1 receptor domain-containing protein [Acinetobacter]MCW8689378.1 TIR domain-containing protein [Acinetobacter baumannii]MCW8766498.1 TIR domain-containing protein [Acinetobacter baumannii]MDH0720100.1 TIR domain-containing protein [Acinetobacter junii]MQZ56076.1 TIR domain-containing protein [Acinetobacter junii]
MSIQSISSTISRLNKELSDITHRMSLEQTKASSVAAKIIQLQTSITKTTTASTLKTKLSEISRKEQENAQIQKKLSDLQKKKTDIQNKLLKENQNLAKAEALERKKLDALAKKQQKEEIEHQKKLKREIESIKASTQHITGATASPYLDVTPEPEYDLFISHASEDKDDFVRPLAETLQGLGLKVWYDEFSMRVGDSLRRKIDSGLRNSRYGTVVLSADFIKKEWTNYELDALVAREMNGHKMILPIWHKITKTDVMNYSPNLADKIALNTSFSTIEEIAHQLADVVLDK